MGNIMSSLDVFRRDGGADHANDSDDTTQMNKFSSHSGAFFGSHFLMGGERFEVNQPEAFLFGENGDLDLLGTKATPFPYSKYPSTDPMRTLNALVNIRRDSVKFSRVKSSDQPNTQESSDGQLSPQQSQHRNANEPYRIEFVFDCDSACCIQLHFMAKEVVTDNNLLEYLSKCPDASSEKFYFTIGANQLFNNFLFYPNKFNIDDMRYDGSQYFPVVIHCQALTDQVVLQSHATYAIIDRSAEGTGLLMLKPLKQKLFVDGVCYLLQEIYGIENKYAENEDTMSSDENGCECIVCMSDIRDTVILPCRHLCLCSACAETLRYKASNCPICRSPFRALLQMKTMRLVNASTVANDVVDQQAQPQRQQVQRFETLSLVEALNGPINHIQTCVTNVSLQHSPTQLAPPVLSTSASDAQILTQTTRRRTSRRRGGAPISIPRVLAPIQQVLTIGAPHTAEAETDTVDLEMENAEHFVSHHPITNTSEHADPEIVSKNESEDEEFEESESDQSTSENASKSVVVVMVDEENEQKSDADDGDHNIIVEDSSGT